MMKNFLKIIVNKLVFFNIKYKFVPIFLLLFIYRNLVKYFCVFVGNE